MKKKLFLLFFSALALLGFVSVSVVNEVKAAAAGEVVFHYQKWYEDYDTAGLWVWGTGTDGTANGVEKAGIDDFGAYFNIAIGSDATSMGVIPIAQSIATDDRWNNKDSYEGMDLTLDVTAAAAGGTMDVYFFSGSDTIFVADPNYINLFVVYFTATEEYETNLGIHAWGTDWYTDEAYGDWSIWGTPTTIFSANFTTPEGKLGKLGMVQATGSDANFLVYAGNDATKKTGDVAGLLTDFSLGDVTAVYIAGDVYKGLDKVGLFADSSFAFKFVPFDNTDNVLSGTYASKPNTILVKFSADVPVAFYDETQEPEQIEYQEYEIVGYEWVLKENPVVQDDTVYDAYVATAIPAGMARLVIHYQKWDGDYSDVGFWTWGTGTGGASAPVLKSGVDDFGAVFELDLGLDATSVGLIPIADSINTDDRWGYKDSFGGADMGYDVTGITDGQQIDIYFFSGGAVFYTADPTKANVIVINMNTAGEYEENLGVHCWGWDQAPAWGTPYPMTHALTSPDGVQGRGVLLTADAANLGSAGLLVYAGDDATKKTGDISGSIFGAASAGDVFVVYTTVDADGHDYTLDRVTFVDQLMTYEKGDPIWDYVTYYEDSYPRVEIDLTPFFSLWDGDTELTDAIEELNYNVEDDAITELVVVLADGQELEAGHEYVLKYNNGEEDPLKEQVAEIAVAIDEEAPVITFISDQEVTITAGEGWDSELWPVMRAEDDRDGNVTDRIYVKTGDGTVDMNEVGVHEVILTVFDNWGNESTATFTINVIAPETGCGAASASIAGIGLFGIILFFVKRKEWI